MMTSLYVILGVIVVIFIIAFVVIWQIQKKRNAERENLFPTGADETDFTRALQEKYEKEGR